MILDEARGWISIATGFILTALGIIPLLAAWKIIGFNLPAFLSGIFPQIAMFIIAAGGLYVIVDGFWEDDTPKIITLALGILFFLTGIVQILGNFGVIGFMIPIPAMVYQIIFVIEGILLILAAFIIY